MGKDVEDVQVVRPESLEQIVTCAGPNSLRHLANGDCRSSAESRCVSGALAPLLKTWAAGCAASNLNPRGTSF